MKRVLFLLLVSVFMLPAFHSEAQVQGTQTPTHYQELTKQQQRQVKRDLRKKAREVANQQAFNVQGTPSQITTNTDKHGNITYSFYVNGIALTAQVVVNLSAGSNYANATVYPMMNGNNLTFSGTLVPTSQSGIFRSGFISY